MDVGLVCDQCDTFNPMAAAACSSCGTALSLGGAKKVAVPSVHQGAPPLGGGTPPSLPPPGQVPSFAPATPSAVAKATVPPVEEDLEKTAAKGSPPPSRLCKECGNPIQPGFRFCGTCGAKVDSVPAKPGGGERRTMFFGAMQAARAKLVLIKGDGLDGISFTLAGQDHIAGRTEGPLLFQDDPFLSPKHANFYYKDGKLNVRDEGSANGIFVRTRAPMPLRTGDTFLVGEQVMRVETTPPETAGLGPDADGTYVFASPRRASRLRLVQLLRGGDIGLVFRAAGDGITLGRDGNDINFPDDPFISGKHAQVAYGDGGLMLNDLGSKNGTFLRIQKDTALAHGDYVFMGQQLLRVEIV